MRRAIASNFVRGLILPAILAGMFLVAGCNSKSDSTTGTNGGGGGGAGGKKLTICMLPKQTGIPYFTTCSVGAQEAAKELGDVNLIYDGPADGKADTAAQLVNKWTLQGVDAICVSVNDPAVLGPAMKKARDAGIHVITWDADAAKETRELFVNQASAQEIGEALTDTLAKDIGGDSPEGDIVIVSATPEAANQNEWIKYITARLKDKYPKLNLLPTVYSNDNETTAKEKTQDVIKAYPTLKGVLAISSAAFPGSAEAIKEAGKVGQIQITGLSTPNDMKKFVNDGTVKSVVLWNTNDLGYLTIKAAEALATGKLKPGATTFDAGRLGTRDIVDGDKLMLGKILVFNKDNINNFDF
jgi:rhamnose ABC transporter rhamnose-binding protein